MFVIYRSGVHVSMRVTERTGFRILVRVDQGNHLTLSKPVGVLPTWVPRWEPPCALVFWYSLGGQRDQLNKPGLDVFGEARELCRSLRELIRGQLSPWSLCSGEARLEVARGGEFDYPYHLQVTHSGSVVAGCPVLRSDLLGVYELLTDYFEPDEPSSA